MFGLRFHITFIALVMQFISSPLVHAQGAIVYQDDFEGVVAGWSDNTTEYAPIVGTNFLGRFTNGSTDTSRTFTVPSGTTVLNIEFDLLRFDSWDFYNAANSDGFSVLIDGNPIFSTTVSFGTYDFLPFGVGQGARSGTSGNVDWSHIPTNPTATQIANGQQQQELGFNTGQYWYDQIHRFKITVNNPGTTVTLTLRADVDQTINDESAGYDNFLVTSDAASATEITAVAESFAPIDSAVGGVTSSVLASDTFDNQPATLNDVILSVLNSSSPNVVLDPLTGLITVNAGTAAGLYTTQYEICEISEPTNCSSVIETIQVRMSNPGGTFCPNGSSLVPGTYHAVSATGGNNPNLTLGQPVSEGTTLTNSAVTFYGAMTLDLTGSPTILAAEGDVIEVALSSHWGTQARAEILMSADGVSFTSLGTTGNGGSVYGPWASNVIRYDDFTVPAGGARYLQVNREASGVRVDGVIYDSQCQPSATAPVIVATDDAETVTSLSTVQNNVLNVLDNDTFDGTTPANFDLAISTGSMLPAELTFDTVTGEVGVVAGTIVGAYSFDYDICESGTTNCETATVTITTEAAPILALAETLPAINGASGGVTTTVLASDTLNNQPVIAADVTITVGTSAPELTLDPNTGFITVNTQTLAGTYTVEYTICENLNSANCNTVTETVEVRAAVADISILKTNTLGVNGNIDQANDTLVSGQVTTYSLVVTNNGPDSVTGAVVTDNPTSGLTCTGTDAVTLSGDGVPTGSFTIADLTGAGITLDTLADGQSTTLSYSCDVN